MTKTKVWLAGTLLYCVTIDPSTVVEGSIIAGAAVLLASVFFKEMK